MRTSYDEQARWLVLYRDRIAVVANFAPERQAVPLEGHPDGVLLCSAGGFIFRPDEIELTVTGRSSGRPISRPVWFVQEGGILYLLPVTGGDSQWYRNVLKTPAITLTVDGVRWNGKATPITQPAGVREVVEKFRAKYGADEVAKYYSKFDVAVAVPLA